MESLRKSKEKPKEAEITINNFNLKILLFIKHIVIILDNHLLLLYNHLLTLTFNNNIIINYFI